MPPADVTRGPRGLQIFRGRRLGPLFSAWVGGAIVGGLLFWLDMTQPAFHDVLLPLYGVIAVMVAIATWRWVRARRGDRRAAERRKHGRRETDTHEIL